MILRKSKYLQCDRFWMTSGEICNVPCSKSSIKYTAICSLLSQPPNAFINPWNSEMGLELNINNFPAKYKCICIPFRLSDSCMFYHVSKIRIRMVIVNDKYLPNYTCTEHLCTRWKQLLTCKNLFTYCHAYFKIMQIPFLRTIFMISYQTSKEWHLSK